MNKKIEAILEQRTALESAVDDEVSRLIQAELDRLEKETGDKWKFFSGMGTWFFDRNGEALHDPIPETEEFLQKLEDLNDQMRYAGFYPSFCSKGKG